MKKTKQIIAIIIVIVLVGMYVAAFVMALTDNPATMSMFRGCIACTIFVPVASYGAICLHRYAMDRSKRRDVYSRSASKQPGDNDRSDDKPSQPH